MDNVDIRYEPYLGFRRVDTMGPFDTIEIPPDEGVPVRIAQEHVRRGHRADHLYYDEFVDYDRIVDTFNSVQTEYTINANDIYVSFDHLWNETGQYELSFDGKGITIKQKEAPDFGELSPSQELNDFVNTLVQGE